MEIDLSVITATWRRQNLLGLCLSQFRQQSLGSLQCEHIIVSDGPDRLAQAAAGQYGARFIARSHTGGKWGAFAKDTGIAAARGAYVCFWDDDNQYQQHALATLYAAAYGYDIGLVQTVHWDHIDPICKVIPENFTGKFELGNVDTMCVCVRRKVAQSERWGLEDSQKGTDFHWLSRLQKQGATVRFVPVAIGSHL